MSMQTAARNYLRLAGSVSISANSVVMLAAIYLRAAICWLPGSARANPFSRVANEICRVEFSTAKFAMVYP